MNLGRRSSGVFAAPALLLTLAVAALLVALCSPPALATPPQVTNVVAAQRPETKLVDVTYDIYDREGDAMTVALYLSPDGGQSFPVECVAVSGDVGEGVTNGTGRHIEWDAGADYPDHVGDDYVVKVTADDGTGPEGMIWIPAGYVRMGQVVIAEPVHDFYVEGFYIDALEVTNAEYKEFIDAGGYQNSAWWNPVGWVWGVAYDITLPYHWNDATYHGGGIPGNEGFPANGVSWWEVDAYCRWAGKRLPTEAEWEKAAKGGCETHGDPGQCDDSDTPTYPWGEGISGHRVNCAGSGDPYEYNGWTTPVGYYDGSNHGGYQTINSPSPYGLYDVAGNAYEWCSTKYASYPYDPNDGRENPPATYNECCRVLRGGSWNQDPSPLRCAVRISYLPSSRYSYLGFRCARTASGDTGWGVSPPFHLDTTDSQASIGAAERAQGFRASVAGPNIFMERLAVQVALPGPGVLGVTIIDAAGRHVRTLADAEYPRGMYMLVWDGRRDDGQSAPAGVYFVRSSFHGRTETRRAMLIR